MKKWMVIAIAMVLAGCGEVSVEGESDGNKEAQTEGNCNSLIKECRDDGRGQYKLYVICKDEDKEIDSIKAGPLCDCEVGTAECKSETVVPPEPSTCPEECPEGYQCDLNTMECVMCLSNSDCNEGEQCIENLCINSEQQDECEKNEDCDDNKICKNNKCEDYEPVTESNCSKLEPLCEKIGEEEHYTLFIQCIDNSDIRENVGCECDGSDSKTCKANEACQEGYVTQCSDRKIIMGCKDKLEDGHLNDYEELFDCGGLFCMGEEGGYAQCVECVDGDKTRGCGDDKLCINNKCEDKSNYDVVCDSNGYLSVTRNQEEISKIECSKGCSKDETGKAFCIEHQEVLCTEYDFKCNKDNTGIDLVCSNNGEIRKGVFECGEKEVCDGTLNECVPKPFVSYDCEKDTEKVRQEIRDSLDELGVYDYELYNSCLGNIVTENNASKYDTGNKCIVLCGKNINANTFQAKSKNQDIVYLGINNATITNTDKRMTAPLFKAELRNITIANVTLDYNLELGNTTKGMLANNSNTKTVVSGVKVSGRTLSYNKKDMLNDVGTLIGNAKNTMFKNIYINNVNIELNDRNKDKLHEYIGGVAGYTENVIVTSPVINGLTISGKENDKDYMQFVGGLFGYAKNISIKGTSDSYVDVKQISHSERDTGGLVGHLDGKFDVENLRINVDKIETHFPCAGGIIGYGWDAENNSNIMLIDNVDLTVGNITAGRYIGGMIGIQDGSSHFAIKNSKIVTNSLYGANHCDGDNECDGSYVGGLVGNLRGKSSLIVSSVKNEFNTIKSDSQFTGGVLGGITGTTNSITIYDVINRSFGSDSKIIASKYAGGLIGAAGNDDYLLTSIKISDVISETQLVKANDSNGGGFISSVKLNSCADSKSINSYINNVILMTDVKGKEVGGFIGSISLNDFNLVSISNILSRVSIESPDDTIGGLFYKIDKWKNDDVTSTDFLVRLGVSNVLSDAKTLVKSGDNIQWCDSVKNNVVNIIDGIDNACNNTNDTSDDQIEKKKMRLIFNNDNIYYAAPWDENHVDNAGKNFFDYSMCGRDGTTCPEFKDYKTPFKQCWFTNYVVENNGDYTRLTKSAYPYLYPFIPFFTSTAKLKHEAGCNGYNAYSISSEDSNIDHKYVDNVLKSLNNAKIIVYSLGEITDFKTNWVECKDIKNVITSSNYPNLLCPVLSGKFTCLGTSNSDGTFDPDGKCESI